MSPNSVSFALVIGALAALPSFGIDMSLPALGAIGASLGVGADRAGLTISLFMIGYAVAPPFCGPVSDRIGRKPIMLGAVALFAVASLGCTVSQSLATLLSWRVLQGMGAGVCTTMTFAVLQDLFDGPEGRAKFSDVATLIVLVPMVAPAAGTAVLAVGGWRTIYGLLAVVGAVLFVALWLFFAESAKMAGAARLNPAAILRSYGLVLGHPVALGYILVNAAAFGALFAYISGSSLYFIDALGLSRGEYSLAYAATFVGIMAGVLANGRLSRWHVSPRLSARDRYCSRARFGRRVPRRRPERLALGAGTGRNPRSRHAGFRADRAQCHPRRPAALAGPGRRRQRDVGLRPGTDPVRFERGRRVLQRLESGAVHGARHAP